MASIEGNRVLVVGGSSGIGQAVARQAAALGAQVTIASRSARKLAAAAQAIGGGVSTAVLDSTDAQAVEAYFAGQAAFDHIVVSAAVTPIASVRDLSLTDARSAMESKFWGAYHVARGAKLTERGSLTLVSGFLADRPVAGAALQGAINAALDSLARGLALELSPVRVNTVSPGMIDTPLWAGMDEGARDAMYAGVAAGVPAKVMGQPTDVANAVLYLMQTPFATGSTVRVDGGGAIG
jgi:NAD(P)-dependent dehydrogenase (short-subunit alcohol dehydrogenase family)